MFNTESTLKEYESYCYRQREAGNIPLTKENYDLERVKGRFRRDGAYVGIEWNERLGYPRIMKPFICENGQIDNIALITYYRILSSLDLTMLPRWKRFRIRKNLKTFKKYVDKYFEKNSEKDLEAA